MEMKNYFPGSRSSEVSRLSSECSSVCVDSASELDDDPDDAEVHSSLLPPEVELRPLFTRVEFKLL